MPNQGRWDVSDIYQAIEHARSCLRTIGETKMVQIRRADLQSLLIALDNYERTMAVLATPTPGAPIMTITTEQESRFWLIVREPGMVPDRKGPFKVTDTAKVLREFMAANPLAFIDYLTVTPDGEPYVDHGPQVLQFTDGRSMSVGRKHNARVKAAALATRPPAEDAVERVRLAIDAGLASFIGSTSDFDMSAGMRRNAIDHILGQPGVFTALAALSGTGEAALEPPAVS